MSDQDERLDAGDASSGEGPFSIPPELPILPLRDTVLFPNSFMPLAVARETSVRLIDDAIVGGKLVGIFTQRDASVEEPGQEDLYQIGTATHVHKMFKFAGWQPPPDRPRACPSASRSGDLGQSVSSRGGEPRGGDDRR